MPASRLQNCVLGRHPHGIVHHGAGHGTGLADGLWFRRGRYLIVFDPLTFVLDRWKHAIRSVIMNHHPGAMGLQLAPHARGGGGGGGAAARPESKDVVALSVSKRSTGNCPRFPVRCARPFYDLPPSLIQRLTSSCVSICAVPVKMS